MNHYKLRVEIDEDELGRGYSGMTNSEIADDLNTEYRTKVIERLNPADVANCIDTTDYLGLDANEQAEIWDWLHVGGDLWVRSGDIARTRFVTIFGVGSTTISGLVPLLTEYISRAEELGLGFVRESDVVKAKAL